MDEATRWRWRDARCVKLFRPRREVSGGAADVTRGLSNSGPTEHGEPVSVQQCDWALAVGSYVTDGASLFRVAHTLSDQRGGELLVELEDCQTLELVLCSAAAMADMRLHSVTPAAVG